MKKIFSLLLLLTLSIHAQDYQVLWDEIRTLEQQNLPKSALEKVTYIYQQAKQEENESAFIKALLHKEKYQSTLQEDGYLKAIEDIQKELTTTTKSSTKLLLKSILAQMYANYLEYHRYKIEKRTPIKGDQSDDIRTWSIEQLVQKSSQLYLDSLGEEAKDINMESYRDILTSSKNSEGLRPTLYDFLAFRALAYFNNERNYLTKPRYSFYLDEKEAFGSQGSFIHHTFKSSDKSSFKYQTLLIYQALLRFHQDRRDQKVLQHINFERLRFVYNNFTGANRDKYYLQTLNSLESQYTNSEALYYLADYYNQKGDFTKAITYAKKGIKSQDNYISTQCQNIKNGIESKSINFYMEKVNLPHEPILSKIEYKNLNHLFVRVVKLTPKEYRHIFNSYGKQRDAYIKVLPTFKEFSLTLPSTDDYKRHGTEVSLGSYDLGQYIFTLSTDKEFRYHVVHNFSTLSKLAYFYKNAKLLVVDRESGEPLKGVEAKFYTHQSQNNRRNDNKKIIATKTTDANGLVDIPKSQEAPLLQLQYGEDILDSARTTYHNYPHRERKNRPYEQVYFFTDRAIYRPAQTIYFKGLAIHRETKERPTILPNHEVKVSFYNANNQNIGTKIFKTDTFGTFHGSFVSPKKGRLGIMRIVAEGINGSKSIRIEEYKRPKFEVIFDKPTQSYRLGSTVTLHGKANAYAGYGLAGAKVRYTVQRVARFPWIDCYRPIPRASNQQIAMGEATTDADGKFQISFDALADPSLSPQTNPNFTYTVSVDITDTTGETQSNSRDIHLGFVAIMADMIIDDELDINRAKKLKLTTTNLDGEFEPLQGEIVIEKFKKQKHLYRKRYWSTIDQMSYTQEAFEKLFKHYRYPKHEKNREKELIKRLPFDTQNTKELLLEGLAQGEYLLTLHTQDRYGTKVQKSKKITIYEIDAPSPPHLTPLWQKLDKSTYGIGSTATLLLKSSSPQTKAYLSIEKQGKIVKEKWITIQGLTKELITIKPKDRGGLFYHINLIQNNRNYSVEGKITVPWDEKIKVEYLSFRDKLKPNTKEQWRIKISGEGKDKIMAQMVATMYDASLDTFVPHEFSLPNLYPQRHIEHHNRWFCDSFSLINNAINWGARSRYIQRVFPRLNWFGLSIHAQRDKVYAVEAMVAPAPTLNAMDSSQYGGAYVMDEESGMGGDISDPSIISTPPMARTSSKKPKKSAITIRKNLQETLFFKPNLQTDKEGNILIDFTTNEALTRWNFLGFIHTKGLQTAITQKEIITQKELMVTTNLPRFFREKDIITLSAKVVNISNQDLNGTCELKLTNPINGWNIYGDHNFTQPFGVKKGASTVVSFTIRVPDVDTIPAIQHTIIARTKTHTDAEQVIKPILSNRMFVTESKALSIQGKEQKSFSFASLKNNHSTTLKNHKLTLEFTSNPAWVAIKSLPYLMEYPHECSEQLFSRYYANAIASKIANSSPKIKKIFESWKSRDELKSALTTNQELKSILLEETPWVLEAQSEEEQLKNIGMLFDLVKLGEEQQDAYDRLIKRQFQHRDGGWAWFEGGESNWYITQYIVEGFGKLKKLGIDKTNTEAMGVATAFMDRKMLKHYNALQKRVEQGEANLADDHLSSMLIHYLYARSFYSFKMNKKIQQAHDYYLSQAKKYWTTKGLYEQGLIALTLQTKKAKKEAKAIVKSLKERALVNEELGMYFKYTNGFYWNEMPIETHALMIEVFDTIAHDKTSVEQLKVWLLKNRQTTHWKTTKATASAIYALLLDDQWLSNDQLVKISFDTPIPYQPILEKAQASAQKGTGYFKASFEQFDSSMATIKVKNPNTNIAWGGLYWQYFEELDKIKTFKATPLTIDKKLFFVEKSDRGENLIPLANQTLKVGDKVKVRIEIRVDRDMEYIMLKDSRASAFEPTNTLSQYQWQDGLGYYESTKDNATYFFMDYLKRGTYVFEYPLVVTHRGEFSNGITTIESMYAPEFRSHSEGMRVRVE